MGKHMTTEAGGGDNGWVYRIHRDHERHAGIPDWGWCPLDNVARPYVKMVTTPMLAELHRAYSACPNCGKDRELGAFTHYMTCGDCFGGASQSW